MRYLIKLKDLHEQSGHSVYHVAKSLNLNYGTVSKYLKEYVIAEMLPIHVIEMVKFYGADWRNPAVIEVIEGEESTPDNETPLALPA